MFSNEGNRRYARNVLIVIASTYSVNTAADVLQLATQFKIMNGVIIVIRYQQVVSAQLDRICEIASPGMCFSNLQNTSFTNIYKQTMDALCEANCFCRRNEHPYKNATIDKNFATCIKPINAPDTSDAANATCHAERDSQLPPIYEREKLAFLSDIADDTLDSEPFWIGLRYFADMSQPDWYWVAMDGNLTRYRNSESDVPFALGSYNHTAGNDCALLQKNDVGAYEIHGSMCSNPAQSLHYFMCQSHACDTDNFCPDVETEYRLSEAAAKDI